MRCATRLCWISLTPKSRLTQIKHINRRLPALSRLSWEFFPTNSNLFVIHTHANADSDNMLSQPPSNHQTMLLHLWTEGIDLHRCPQTLSVLAYNDCAPSALIRPRECCLHRNNPRCRSYQIPGELFWICGCLYVQRPLGSKWKHPSLAAPPASASHSIDVEKASSLITFHIAELMEFGSVIVIRAKLNCMKLFNWTINDQTIYMAHVMWSREQFLCAICTASMAVQPC